jgi:hypothetical protein
MNTYLKIWMKSGAYSGIWVGIYILLQHNNYIAAAINGVVAGLLCGTANAGLTYLIHTITSRL